MTTHTPTVGMGGTLHWYSDRTPCTVVAVSKGLHKIVVQEDRAIRTDKNGMSEVQSYLFETNPDGAKYTLTRRRDGRYVVAGRGRSGSLTLGARGCYHDFSF